VNLAPSYCAETHLKLHPNGQPQPLFRLEA
jgi:hypothetical protein